MRRARRLVLVPLLAAGLLASGGCLGDDPAPVADSRAHEGDGHSHKDHARSDSTDEAGDQAGSGSGSTQASGQGSATATSSPGGTGSAKQSGLATGLLPAEGLPGFNDRFSWTMRSTAGETDPTGSCQRFTMTTIGAMRATVRAFDSPDTERAHATQVVARFPDARTAQRAYATLVGWHDQCSERLMQHRRVDVGDLDQVPVAHGAGHWYLLSFGPAQGDPDANYFESVGIVKYHRMLSVVEMTMVGQDFNYGDVTPAETAVARISGRLG